MSFHNEGDPPKSKTRTRQTHLLDALSLRNFDGIIEQNLARLRGLTIEALVFLAPGVEVGRLEGNARERPLAEGVVDRDAQSPPLGEVERCIGLPPQRPHRGSDLRVYEKRRGMRTRVRGVSVTRADRNHIIQRPKERAEEREISPDSRSSPDARPRRYSTSRRP